MDHTTLTVGSFAVLAAADTDTGWEITGSVAQILAAIVTFAAVVVALRTANREHDTAKRALDLAEREQALRLSASLSIESRLGPSKPQWELVVTNRGQHEARDVHLRDDPEAHPQGNNPVMGHYHRTDGEDDRPHVDYLAPNQTIVMSRGVVMADDMTAYVCLTWVDGRGSHKELRQVPLIPA